MALQSLKDLKMPTRKELERYYKDPEILTSEILFMILTLSNVFVVYRLFLDIIPYPIFVTWWQISQGLLMAYILGEAGVEFPKLQYFPRVEINKNLCKKLIIPTIINILMLVFSNVILYRIPCIATLPIVVSFSVVLHHLTRFIGCGEEYLPLRWYSILFLFSAYLLGITDKYTISMAILPYSLLYAFFSSAFRAAFLQKVMHVVDGRGNLLHNHQHFLGFVLLPILIIFAGEYRVFLSSSLLGPNISNSISATSYETPLSFLSTPATLLQLPNAEVANMKDLQSSFGSFFGGNDEKEEKIKAMLVSLFSSKNDGDLEDLNALSHTSSKAVADMSSKLDNSLLSFGRKDDSKLISSSSQLLPSSSLSSSLTSASASWFSSSAPNVDAKNMSTSWFLPSKNDPKNESLEASLFSSPKTETENIAEKILSSFWSSASKEDKEKLAASLWSSASKEEKNVLATSLWSATPKEQKDKIAASFWSSSNSVETPDSKSKASVLTSRLIESNETAILSFNLFSSLHTLQLWGCLITVGTLPFLKNIVSNRLIRRTGQGPWRFLEILSIVLVFLIGLNFGVPGWQGFICIILVLLGRTLGACDVLINAQEMEAAAGDRRGGYGRDDAETSSQTSQKPFLNQDEENQSSDEYRQHAQYGDVSESE